MVNNETRKLMKLLQLQDDDIYHVFCLALCVANIDGRVSDEGGEMLTRIGFGLGLGPEEIEVMGHKSQLAIAESSVGEVVTHSLTKLKSRLEPDQMSGIKQILKFVALSDHKIDKREKALLDVVDQIWPND